MDEETGSQYGGTLQNIATVLGIPLADLIVRGCDGGPTPE